MIVTSRISVDLTRANPDARVYAVQGDGSTRAVEIELLSGGLKWEPPVGVEAAVAYGLPDGHRGLYDRLADGTPAVFVAENRATVMLASQMLCSAGTLQVSLVFNDAQLNRLSTFPFTVCVAGDPGKGQPTEEFIKLRWLEEKLDEYLKRESASGKYDGKEGKSAYDVAVVNGFTGSVEAWLASLKGSRGEKGDRGDSGKSAYQYAVEAGFAGTEEAFREGLLNSGKTAYEYACDGGYTGTVAEFSARLAAEHAPANHNHDGNYAPQNHDHAAIQTAADNAMNRANEAWNLANGKPVMTTETLTLSAAGWENGQQTLPCQSAQGTDNQAVLVSPEPGAENWESYTQCGVRCIGEGDGTLAFSCDQVPGIDLTVHVAVFRNGGNADGT